MSDDKPSLRRHFRARRRDFVASLSADRRAGLERDLAAVVAPLLGDHRVAAIYAAQGPEIDPQPLAALLGHHAFPRICDGELFFHIAARPDLVPGSGGIPEPRATAPLVTPDLLLLPLIAAAADGTRLGQGGGYYDRALKALRARGPVVAIGLAWDVQIAESLPLDPWDERIDLIATPSHLVDCARHG
jgi:5-formyltetrahydrofolate cyclo-ligase